MKMNEISIDELYKHNKNILVKFILSNYSQINIEDAEDLVQDTFLDIMRKQKSIELTENIAGLLYIICQRRALDYLKKKSTVNEIAMSRLDNKLFGAINGFLYGEYQDQYE